MALFAPGPSCSSRILNRADFLPLLSAPAAAPPASGLPRPLLLLLPPATGVEEAQKRGWGRGGRLPVAGVSVGGGGSLPLNSKWDRACREGWGAGAWCIRQGWSGEGMGRAGAGSEHNFGGSG